MCVGPRNIFIILTRIIEIIFEIMIAWGTFRLKSDLKRASEMWAFIFLQLWISPKVSGVPPKIFELKWSLITSYCMAVFLENWHYHNQTETLTVWKKKCNFCHFLNILIWRFMTLTSIIEKIRWERSYKICIIRCLWWWKYCIPSIIKLTLLSLFECTCEE